MCGGGLSTFGWLTSHCRAARNSLLTSTQQQQYPTNIFAHICPPPSCCISCSSHPMAWCHPPQRAASRRDHEGGVEGPGAARVVNRMAASLKKAGVWGRDGAYCRMLAWGGDGGLPVCVWEASCRVLPCCCTEGAQACSVTLIGVCQHCVCGHHTPGCLTALHCL